MLGKRLITKMFDYQKKVNKKDYEINLATHQNYSNLSTPEHNGQPFVLIATDRPTEQGEVNFKISKDKNLKAVLA